jgi:hypothetical protein
VPKVFLSYSHQDENLARELVVDLRRRGVSVWYAPDEILVGHDIVDRVYDGIRNSRFLAILLTPRSTNSKWVRQELNFAKVIEIERDQVVILPLLFEETPIPGPLRTKRYADFRTNRATGIDDLLRAIGMDNSPGDLGERVSDLEDEVEERCGTIYSLARSLFAASSTEGDRRTLRKGWEEIFAKLEGEVEQTLDLIDRLISMEDEDGLILHHCKRGIELCGMISTAKREAHYFEIALERANPTVDNLILLAIAHACSENPRRSVSSYRRAIRHYKSLCRKLSTPDQAANDLVKFLYRVTRHIRLEETNFPEYRDLVIFRDKPQAIVDRLNLSMDCLDEALKRELILSKENPVSYLSYANMMEFIGLTMRAVDHAELFIALDFDSEVTAQLGLELSDTHKKIEDLRGKIEKVKEDISSGEGFSVQCDPVQMANFFFQFGMPAGIYEEIASTQIPQFADDFIKNPAFSTSVEASSDLKLKS